MTPIDALITAARRYCMENFSYWADRYSNDRSGSEFPKYSYSDRDYDLFPRYNVLSAILAQVEILVGKTYPELQTCREELAQIGLTAQSLFTKGEKNAIANTAIKNERNKFVHFVRTITLGELGLEEPLPHRRRLSPEEKNVVRQQLLERWNYDGSYWDPLVDKCPTTSLFLAKEHITNADYDAIIHFIAGYAAFPLLEITEDGADAEIDHTEFHPDCYETIYCDHTYNWVIYGSHESTITFAGEQLLPFINKLFVARESDLNKWPKIT